MQVLLVGRAPEPLNNVKEHTHPHWEIVVITEGEGWTRIARERWEFQKGDLYVVPPYTPHAAGSDTGFRDVYFHVDKLPFRTDLITLVGDLEESPALAELMYTMYLRQGRRTALDSLGDVLVQLAADRLDLTLADADGDKDVTSTDARLILQYAVEMIDEWPAAA